MRKILNSLSVIVFIAVLPCTLHAQQKLFQEIKPVKSSMGNILDITQDRLGYVWLTGMDAEHGNGLFRYNGSDFTYYSPDTSGNAKVFDATSLCTDSSGMIWVGTYSRGLYRFDPMTHVFTQFRHSPKIPSSLANDTIRLGGGLLTDHEGNVWIGTGRGLDMLQPGSTKFIHFGHKAGDASSLSSNRIGKIYEDPEGNLWVSCGSDSRQNEKGGLNLFNRKTRTFTQYIPDPGNPESPENNITSIYQDNKGTIWLGALNNRIMTFDKKTGDFTKYPYDSLHPEKLGSLPLRSRVNIITSIRGDAKGNIWIGTYGQGIQKYNPRSGEIKHFGMLWLAPDKVVRDTLDGFNAPYVNSLFIDKNGLLWFGSATLYMINPFRKNIPYDSTKQAFVNAFYKDESSNLWIATDDGLLYKPVHGKEKVYVHQPDNPNSPSITGISTMIADKEGNLWLGTYEAVTPSQKLAQLDKFNPATGKFTHYTISTKWKATRIYNLCFDDNERSLWIGTDNGLFEMNTQTGNISRQFRHNRTDTNGISNNWVNQVAPYGTFLWISTFSGLDRLNKKNGSWQHYLVRQAVNCVYKDTEGILWAGTTGGLFRYNATQNRFHRYRDTTTDFSPTGISNIQEDDRHNLWATGINTIYRIPADRKSLYLYGPQNGVDLNITANQISYQSQDGKLYMGNRKGYYSFYPDSLGTDFIRPAVYITGFHLGNKEVLPGPESLLKKPLFETKEIRLSHDQNSFSLDFEALNYTDQEPVHYRYMMQGYDNRWHDASEQQKAYFFGLPPGHYVFKVMAINSNNLWGEKDIMIIISPPWWTTWWGISILAAALIGIIWAAVYVRSRQLRKANKLLEEKVTHRTEQLKKSLEELKSTQSQLIQSEKMASLGELTAGIAHEIQNPLNFVNNFSEINKELIEELKVKNEELKIENADVKDLLNDIEDNSEKINHHGKRADAIVKSMLQHSRTSSGKKELTDINALADEYLRLSYHGMRAKDKSFNCEMKTEFDESLEKINVVPQDIGRVFLNLFNNAFFACNERSRAETLEGFQNLQGLDAYVPTVTLVTRKENDHVTITVRDNGNGIPEKIKDKIFQPFFTTKPTGQGTGLGLSLAYDIVKSHGGYLKVRSKEGEGTEFTIIL